jgi:hypothetical protein
MYVGQVLTHHLGHLSGQVALCCHTFLCNTACKLVPALCAWLLIAVTAEPAAAAAEGSALCSKGLVHTPNVITGLH